MARLGKILEKEEWGSVVLDPKSPMVRTPPRPAMRQQQGYTETFDFTTLFYDTFLMPSGRQILLVGPLLLNLSGAVEEGEAIVADCAGLCAVTGYQLTHKKKVSVLTIDLERQVETAWLKLDFGVLGRFEQAVGENLNDLFKGKRAAFTLFKYEPLAWLVDWAEFNVRYHGVNSLLVQHNNSPDFSTQVIYDALNGVDGIETLVVGHWPYRYGPAAGGGFGWDSDFCQMGFFEMARQRFLGDAEGVLNTDIDELVITNDHRSVFEYFEESPTGFLRFGGVYISGKVGRNVGKDFSERRHRHYCFFDPCGDNNFCTKWAVKPGGHVNDHQWRIHGIEGLKTPQHIAEQITLCHFKDINMLWKHESIKELDTPVVHKGLSEAFRRVGWR